MGDRKVMHLGLGEWETGRGGRRRESIGIYGSNAQTPVVGTDVGRGNDWNLRDRKDLGWTRYLHRKGGKTPDPRGMVEETRSPKGVGIDAIVDSVNPRPACSGVMK